MFSQTIAEMFYCVLNMSIFGAVAGLFVLILRKIRGLPRFGVYLLWSLPFLRFCLPISVASEYSLWNVIPRYKVVAVWEKVPRMSFANSVMAVESYNPVVYKTDLLKDVFTIGGTVWAIVAAGAGLCALMLYIITKSALKNAVHVGENVYKSDKVISPAVYGIFKPKIILPLTPYDSQSDSELKYILTHEKIHIKRRDNLWRIIVVLIACAHWFNPLIWVFLKCFFTDMELSCDESVLKKLNRSERADYAETLLRYSAGKTYYGAAFGGAKTRLRIENILSYRKLTLASTLSFAALAAVICVTLITNGTSP